jgi:hypothetical protein
MNFSYLSQIVLSIIACIGGAWLIAQTLIAAVSTYIVPRGINHWLIRFVYYRIRKIFGMYVRTQTDYNRKDLIMAFFAPTALVLVALCLLVFLMLGYSMVYWGLGVRPYFDAFHLSGSSLLTLGFDDAKSWLFTPLIFSEAMLGTFFTAILIGYIPTIYASFSKREALVNLLEVRAGSRISPLEMILRAHRLNRFEHFGDLWEQWEMWFSEVEETHTSLVAVAFFRSQKPNLSWVTAAGCVLDTAALELSLLDKTSDIRAALTIRAGTVCLRSLGDFFRIPYNADPKPSDPISIQRYQFDLLCEELRNGGVPLKADLEQAWRDFAGWRVNYDTPGLS